MPGNDDHTADQQRADVERRARRFLAERLGLDEPRPSAVRLLDAYASWASAEPGEEPEDRRDAAVAALTLLTAARAELDALETGVLFAARTSGLTWAQMSGPMGLGSPQAVQQRLDRLATRSGRS